MRCGAGMREKEEEKGNKRVMRFFHTVGISQAAPREQRLTCLERPKVSCPYRGKISKVFSQPDRKFLTGMLYSQMFSPKMLSLFLSQITGLNKKSLMNTTRQTK